jgi:hypothetical protein
MSLLETREVLLVEVAPASCSRVAREEGGGASFMLKLDPVLVEAWEGKERPAGRGLLETHS